MKRHLPIPGADQYSMDGHWDDLWEILFPDNMYVRWSWDGKKKISEENVAHLREHLEEAYRFKFEFSHARPMDVIKLKLHLGSFRAVSKMAGVSPGRISQIYAKGLRVLQHRVLHHDQDPSLLQILHPLTIGQVLFYRTNLSDLPAEEAIKALQGMSDEELLGIRGFGKISLKKLDESLERIGRPRSRPKTLAIPASERPPLRSLSHKSVADMLNRLAAHRTKEQIDKLLFEVIRERKNKGLYVAEGPATDSRIELGSMATEDWLRLEAWAKDPNRKPPELAFTAGLVRDAARAFWEALPKAFAEEKPTQELHFLDQDNSCHWYLVPDSRRAEWEAWNNLPEDDERGWDAPEWAKRLNGSPSNITFRDPGES